MAGFIRARSAEQKERRVAEIKAAAAAQFATRPYHEITLTTIADGLSWSRANLYKYVTTKEEIFLALAADERDAYYAGLLAAFPAGQPARPTPHAAAEAWADVADAHRAWFRLHDLLFTIIEANASVERLVEFKRGYYEQLPTLTARLSDALGVEPTGVEPLMNAVTYHAVGVVTSCCAMPKVREALAQLGVERAPVDFRATMCDFIGMCLAHYAHE